MIFFASFYAPLVFFEVLHRNEDNKLQRQNLDNP